MMLFGPGVKNITTANMTKAMKSGCDMLPQAIFGRACARFDSSMIGDAADHGDHPGEPQRPEPLAEHNARRGGADERHQERERHHLRRSVIAQQPAPQPIGDAGGDAPSASMQSKAGQRHMRQRMPGRRGPSVTSASANSGSGGTRQSQANRSNIGTPFARRSNRLPIAKMTGEIISTAKAPTLKSNPTVPQIIRRPMAATPMPSHLHAASAISPKRQDGKGHREQRLALHDHAGKPDRNALSRSPRTAPGTVRETACR